MFSKMQQANLNIISSWYVTKFSRDLLLPSLTAIMIGLQTTATMVQLSISIYYLGLTISRLFWTPLSDSFGRRRMILICLPIFVLGSILCCFAQHITLFIAGRLLQALGIGCVTSLGRAVLSDVYDKNNTTKALSFLNMFAVWAPAVSTIIGGHLQQWFGWQSGFIFLTLCGVILFLQSYFILQETSQVQTHYVSAHATFKNIYQTAMKLFKHREFCRYLLCYGFIFGGSVVYFTASPILFVHAMKVPAQIYGYFALVTVFGILIGQAITHQLCHRLSTIQLMLVGIGFALLGSISLLILSFIFKPNIFLIMIPVGVFFISNGVLSPVTKAATMNVIPNAAGTASALFGMAQGLSSTITSIFTAMFHEHNAIPMAGLLVTLSLLALVCCVVGSDA